MKISAAESRVLDVLWRLGPVDAGEATAALAESEAWEEATVRTLLRRLIAKKAVAKRKDGRRSVYGPLIARADYAQAESETLIDRFFDGRVSPLVLQFAQRRKLGREDIEELKRLLAELDDGE
jgi:predicted transcriptional regulator